jgi:hypothetical protein
MRYATRGLLTLCLTLASVGLASADPIPYPHPGTPNATTYSFTAQSSGEIIAYFAEHTGAAFDNQIGLLVNGILSLKGFGLDNHTSGVGQSFDMGFANAGDSLIFVLKNNTLKKFAYSDPTLNVPYDSPTFTGTHNHIYSTAYTATSPIFTPDAGFGPVPVGTYIAFEDLPFPGSDFNYHDENFVFTGVNAHPSPEPATLALMGIGLAGLAGHRWLRRRRAAV